MLLFPCTIAAPKFNMAPLLRGKDQTEQAEQKTQPTRNDSAKRVEKAKRIKEQMLNAQAQRSEEKETNTTASTKNDLSPEEKQNMEKFFEWTPPPPPETMGEKLQRKFKQNPLVPVGECSSFLGNLHDRD